MYSVARRGLEARWVEWPARKARRTRRSQRLRRMVARILSNLSLGILLVGCSGIEGGRSFGFREQEAPPLAVLTQSHDPGKRLAALYEMNDDFDSLSEGEQQAALGTLIQIATTEKDPLSRSAAIKVLGHYHQEEAVRAIEQGADDKSPMVREQVCKVFGERRSEAAVETVGRLAQFDSDTDVRIAAATALAEIGTPKCQPHLVECLRDKEIAVAKIAHAEVRKGQPVDLGLDRDAWLTYLKDGSLPDQSQRIATKPEPSLMDRFFR